MPVFYNNNSIIPAPFVQITKQFQTTDDGQIVGSAFNISVKGKLVSYKGSPNSHGTFWTVSGYPPDEVLSDTKNFPAILRKQEALRELFSSQNEGMVFQIQPYDGSAPVTCNPRIKSITFPPGSWYQLCDYEIELEADVIYISGTPVDEDVGDVTNYHISKFSEDWAIEPADEKFLTYRLTHTLTAVGKRFYNNLSVLTQPAWQNARDYIQNVGVLGLDATKITGSLVNLNNNPDFQAFNYARAERIGESQGTYQITETWLLVDPMTGNAVDEFNVGTRISDDRRTQVTVDGTVTGLQISNNATQAITSTKDTNAFAAFNNTIKNQIFNRAQSYSGITLNPVPLTESIARNVQTGIISYSFAYDDRPTALIPGAISEVISFSYNNTADVFARIAVLGRLQGPILQAIGTVTETSLSIGIEAVLPASTLSVGEAAKPQTNALILTFAPAANQLFVARDNETWVPRTGRYTRQTEYVYQ